MFGGSSEPGATDELERKTFSVWIDDYIDTFCQLDRWANPKFSDHDIYLHLKGLDDAGQLRFFRTVLDWLDHPGGRNRVLNTVTNVFSSGALGLNRDAIDVMRMLMVFLLRRSLPMTADDLCRAVKQSLNLIGSYDTDSPVGSILTHVERLAAQGALSDDLLEQLSKMNKTLADNSFYSDQRNNRLRLEKLLGLVDSFKVNRGEPWAAAMCKVLDTMPSTDKALYEAWLEHCQTANASKPSKAWMKASLAFVEPIGAEVLANVLASWFSHLSEPRTDSPPGRGWYGIQFWPTHIDENNAVLLRGMVWTYGALGSAQAPQVLRQVANLMYRKIPGYGPRNAKIGNAAVQALTAIGMPGVNQLALIRLRTSHKSVLKTIDKALAQAAKNAGLSMDQLEDMSVPSYGLQSPGYGEYALGDYVATMQCVAGNRVSLQWRKSDGKQQKTVPKSVKDDHAEELKELKAAVKDIQAMLPAQKARIEGAYLKDRLWSGADWRNYYLDHPLMGFLVRRLIWQVDQDDARQAVLWHEGALRDSEGREVCVADDARICLWHPLNARAEDVLTWRRRLEDLEVLQPFKQAHREIYLLTDAEIATGTYSNRFAAHVLKQHQFNALAGTRGWSYQLQGAWDGGDSIARIDVPEWKLSAEFWVDGIGEYGSGTSESGVFLYVTTDQVRFYAQPEARGGMQGARLDDGPMDLRDVPALAFSEILRDVDLFVGVASVGNDPEWADGGPDGRFREYWANYSFGDLSASAKTRKEQLERLVPKLKIANVAEIQDRFLVIRGKLRTYRIHLGSGNIQMEPNNQYLCIVPGRGKAGDSKDVFLPFEGDQMLSIILSKAFLLADDQKITDRTITSQINRR